MPAAAIGSYRLAEQVGGWAVFADITLTVITRANGCPLVMFDDSIVVDPNCEYLAGITFGVTYAAEFVRNAECVGIIVHELHTNPVDTTQMALAFATCRAVLNCLQIPATTGPYFDRSTKSFVFPGRGAIAK